jgi:diadenosine tetraphosphatase ApaH/serine/threonine PP2A family protein phosphatase
VKLAIITDLHSNLEALERCLEHADAQGAERYVCLGDIVGYGADPAAVVDRLMALPGIITIRGNHDEALFREMSALVPAGIREAIAWTLAQLSPAQKEYLKSLPYVHTDSDVTFVHASAHEPSGWEYIWGTEAAATCLAAATTPVVFIGHTHLPRVYYETEAGDMREFEPPAGEPIPLSPRGRYVVSAGSVGQPRDGSSALCYCLYDNRRRAVTFYRLSYDYHRTAQKIRAAGLDSSFADRLALGR